MSQIIEVSKRVLYHEDDGLACGPSGMIAIDTEIVLNVDDQRVFLHGQWISETGSIYFEATSESIYDAYVAIYNAKDEKGWEEAISERDRIELGKLKNDSQFEKYYNEMELMIAAEKKAHGIESDEDEEDWDE